MGEVARVESRESSEKVRSYRDLVAWQKAMDLMVEVYKATDGFPKNEQFGLTSQLRRAAVSVPSNIAEGSSRRSTQEYIRFINIATGSLAEIETQISAALRLGFLNAASEAELLGRCSEISRILQGLHDALQTRIKTTRLSTLDSEH